MDGICIYGRAGAKGLRGSFVVGPNSKLFPHISKLILLTIELSLDFYFYFYRNGYLRCTYQV